MVDAYTVLVSVNDNFLRFLSLVLLEIEGYR